MYASLISDRLLHSVSSGWNDHSSIASWLKRKALAVASVSNLASGHVKIKTSSAGLHMYAATVLQMTVRNGAQWCINRDLHLLHTISRAIKLRIKYMQDCAQRPRVSSVNWLWCYGHECSLHPWTAWQTQQRAGRRTAQTHRWRSHSSSWSQHPMYVNKQCVIAIQASTNAEDLST